LFIEVPPAYSFRETLHSTQQFLADTETTGMLVIADGHIVHEQYAPPLCPDSVWPCWR
jgi:hypothetical protein